MKKKSANRRQVSKGQYFAVDEDSDTKELSVVFAEDRTFRVVAFVLLESERHRHTDEKYIDGLISAYHRDPGKFAGKRKVTT